MTIWGIADLHLSLARSDRRERHAMRWLDHAAKIEANWRAIVRSEDLVLIPGDISMAVKHREVQPDFDWLARLPGTKILSPGNHDRWWNSAKAIRPMLRRTMIAVEGDAIRSHGVVVCGTRGVGPFEDPKSAQSIREFDRIDTALAEANTLRREGDALIVLWHFPPFDQSRRAGEVVSRLESAGVDHCVYGHLHAEGHWSGAVHGQEGKVRYHCVASDSIGFRPLRILEIPNAF